MVFTIFTRDPAPPATQMEAGDVTTLQWNNLVDLLEGLASEKIHAGAYGLGSIATADIGNDQITFGKTQNIATARILGRNTAGSGDIEELTAATTKSLLAIVRADISDLFPIVDADIGVHTSTKITITTKAQLNSAIVYTDQANIFGDFDQTFKDNRLRIENPAGTFEVQFLTSAEIADRVLTIPLLGANRTMVVTGLANQIGDAEISTHTTTKISTTSKSLLNSAIVYNDQINTYGNFAQTFLDDILFIQNPAGTFEYQIVAGAIGADRILNLPVLTGTDTVAVLSLAQTFSNKSIDADTNTITNIKDADIKAGAAINVTKLENDARIVDLIFIIDGGGATITTGIKGDLQIDYPCTIQQVTMLADQSGSIVVDIWKDSYGNFPATVADTITASAKPTITTATKSQDATLTGWTTSIAAGDHLRFNVDSITTIQRVTLALKVIKT